MSMSVDSYNFIFVFSKAASRAKPGEERKSEWNQALIFA